MIKKGGKDLEISGKTRRPRRVKGRRKRSVVIADDKSYTIDWYSTALALISLLTLVLGALPSVGIISTGGSVAFFDLIQYLPYAFAIFAIIALCAVILNSIFAFVASVPRLVCATLSALSLVSFISALLSADMRLVGGKEGGFLMHGLNYTPVTLISLLLSFASLSSSVLAFIMEREQELE